MKFILNSKSLLEKLLLLNGVINSKNTLPILDNFIFEVNDKLLTLTASDLETTMTTHLELDAEAETKLNFGIDARIIIDILKTLPEQPLVFTLRNESNTIEMSSGSGNYELAYANAEEFPKRVILENPSVTTLPAHVLSSAISKTIFAVSNDDLRPVMSGVFFQFSPERLIFASTDAHKLVKYVREDIHANQVSEFIMPKKPLGILKNALSSSDEEITIEYNDSNASFKLDKFVLTCRLIDGKFPNYEAVIPKENPNKLVINRNSFLNSVKCVSLFSNKSTHQIGLGLGGNELNVFAEDTDYSHKADEHIPCNYIGEEFKIGFNSRFLIEMLNNIQSEEINLDMSMPNRAGVLSPVDGLEEGEHLTMLVMPVVLK